MQNTQLSGSKKVQSTEICASNIEISDSEIDDYPLRTSKMKGLKHPAKPLFQNESDVGVTILSNEESDEEDYHMVTEANRQLHRHSSQYPSFYTTRQDPKQAKKLQLQWKNSLS